MKTVAIIHKDLPEIGTYPPSYAPAYASLYAQGRRRGLDFLEASAYGWDDARGVFMAVRTPEGGILESFRPDVVWHKCSGFNAFTFQLARAYGPAFINGLDVLATARDKYATYRRFSTLMPRTLLLSEALSDPSAVDSWAGDKIVVKPRTGLGGEGVRCLAKLGLVEGTKDIAAVSGAWVVQEWMDSSCGIPGVVDGVHDLRTVIIGGEAAFHSLRSPKSGDFRCNVSAGGSLMDFEPGARPVPRGVLDIVETVVRALGRDGAYSVDCAADASGRVYLGEVNNAPGLKVSSPDGAEAQEKLQARFHGMLCDLFVSVAAKAL